MPLIYRAMRLDQDGPLVGHTQNDTLGIRENIDVQPKDGLVVPGSGGMSVSPSVDDLPPHLIPKRLRHKGYPAARRSNALPDTFPWKMGDGAFIDSGLCPKLQLRVDPDDPRHGFVEPDVPMTLEEHRTAVVATRSDWLRLEW